MRQRWLLAAEGIRQARGAILLAVMLFLAGGIAGAVRPDLFGPFLHALTEIDLPDSYLLKAFRIFLHNIVASYAAVWLGRAWGIFPALAAFLNGAVGGAVLVLAAGRLDVREIALAVVPHAVFELPAAFLALGMGLWTGRAAWRPGDDGESRRRRQRANWVFLLAVLPLLAVAALIESR